MPGTRSARPRSSFDSLCGTGLRRAPFGSDFGELSRAEPQGRRQSSRVSPVKDLEQMRSLSIWRTIVLCALFAIASTAHAWGPHPQITRAAQDVLLEREKAAAYFGEEWKKFEDYCWLGDWRSSVRDDFYPDDYLLF